MAIKLNFSKFDLQCVGTLVSASSGSLLRIFMECEKCLTHSELAIAGEMKCHHCGSTHVERLSVAEQAPDWYKS